MQAADEKFVVEDGPMTGALYTFQYSFVFSSRNSKASDFPKLHPRVYEVLFVWNMSFPPGSLLPREIEQGLFWLVIISFKSCVCSSLFTECSSSFLESVKLGIEFFRSINGYSCEVSFNTEFSLTGPIVYVLFLLARLTLEGACEIVFTCDLNICTFCGEFSS